MTEDQSGQPQAASISDQYDAVAPQLEHALKNKLQPLLEDLLSPELRIHSVTSRLKSRDSLADKLVRRSKSYVHLDDVTDVVGLRVITYFPNDVDAVAAVIEREFLVDPDNSIDKRKALDPDRFGYLSLHYVARLGHNRAALAEYSVVGRRPFEVQIRSVLQHTWAEIEHDLGYKTKQGVPDHIKRDFSRLAGLLELADMEFLRIRNEIDRYDEALPLLISSNPEGVRIDRDSLTAFIQASPLVRQLDEHIAGIRGDVVGETAHPSTVESVVQELAFVGVEKLVDLNQQLQELSDPVRRFAEIWLSRPDTTEHPITIDPGISIFYLAYVLVGMRDDRPFAHAYLEKMVIGVSFSRDEIAQEILDTYREATTDGA